MSETKSVPLDQMDDLAAELLDVCRPSATKATVLALHGDLGAGKTTLVQSIASRLDVVDRITSPTFVIEKIYPLKDQKFDTLVHVDAYRLNSADETAPLRLKELMGAPRTLICIEWAERIKEILPESTTHLSLSVDSDHSRLVSQESHHA